MTDAVQRCAVHEAGHAVACLCLGIPLAHVSIDPADPHCMRAGYQPAHHAGVECLCVMGLSGPEAETRYVGPITDGGDELDYQMVRHYLGCFFGPLQIATQISRHREAAARLVATEWARRRIETIADALLWQRTLSGADIAALL
jgi:hypothetical protein